MDMGAPLSKEVQLISLHTVTKGYWGECGQRGGYFEMTNIPPRVCALTVLVLVITFFVLVIIFWLMQTVEEIYKVASIALSPNVSAQIFVRLFC